MNVFVRPIFWADASRVKASDRLLLIQLTLGFSWCDRASFCARAPGKTAVIFHLRVARMSLLKLCHIGLSLRFVFDLNIIFIKIHGISLYAEY
jgi:hypothetical protein